MQHGYQSYRPHLHYRHKESGREFRKWQREDPRQTNNTPVKYIRKSRAKPLDSLEKTCNKSLDRTDSSPTSCSSGEGKNGPSLKAALTELRNVITGKPINSCYYFPKIHPNSVCQACSIPLPDFLFQGK